MTNTTSSPSAEERLRAENAELRARLEEAEETLRSIRSGEVDALIVETADGPQVFTLQGLEAESNRFRGEILAQVSDSVIAMDLEQRVTYLNAAAERQYRVSASDALGHPLSEIFTRQWPYAGAEAAMEVALREYGDWRGELTHRTHDAREIAVETSITALHDESGVLAGYVAVIRDITERKRSAEELQGVNLLLDTLLQTAPVGFCFLDRDLRYVRINERLALINGIPAEAHLGRHVSEIVPSLVEPLRNVTGRILATGQAVVDHEFSGETPAAPGEMRFWNESWYPLRDGAGEVLGFGGIVEEITARKRAEAQLVNMNENLLVASLRQHELTEKAEWLSVQLQTDLTARMAAEEALRESQHFIHSVLYNLFAFVGVMTVDGTLTDANRSSLEAAGIPASEVIGKKFWDCYWWSYSPEIQAQLRDACVRAAGGEVVRYDVPVRMAGDTRVWIDFQLSPLRDTKGRITHLIPSALEITVRHAAEEALRESEERFRIMADGLPLMIWVHDAQGDLQFVNRAYCEFFGLAPQHVAGPNWHPLVHPEDLAAYESEFSASVRERRPFHAVVRVRRFDGEWRCIESHARPRFSASGEFLGMVGSSPDITERKAAEQELLRYREDLERAVEERTGELAESVAKLVASERLAALGTLAAGIGHDIANITMPIRARLDMLARSVGTAEGKGDIEATLRGIEHLNNLSAGMRLLAMDPERAGASAPVADLAQWCSQTTALFRSAVPRHITVECSMPPGVGVPIPAHRLAQAILNLVQNAAEAMAAQKGGRIGVSAEVAEPPGSARVVLVRVSDDGPGMAPGVLARCFEPYFSTKGRTISTGMGLGMVKGIVEAAGGRVLVESAPGKGATFTLSVPFAPAADQCTASLARSLTAAVSIRHPRTASLACLFLEQLDVSPLRTPPDIIPEAALWIVDDPDPARVAMYLDGHSERRVVMLGAPASNGGGGHDRPGDGGDARVVRLPAMPTPNDLRQALAAEAGDARPRTGEG